MPLIETGVSSQNRGTTDQRIRKTLTLFQYVKQKTKNKRPEGSFLELIKGVRENLQLTTS